MLASLIKLVGEGLCTGGGGAPLYKLRRYVPPHGVGVLRRFGLKTGMVFEGTTGLYERIYRFNCK